MLGQKIFCPNFLEAVPKTQNFCETCPLKSAKLDKDIAKILLLGLKSASTDRNIAILRPSNPLKSYRPR